MFKKMDSLHYFILRGGKELEVVVVVTMVRAVNRAPVNPYRYIPLHEFADVCEHQTIVINNHTSPWVTHIE